MLFNTEATVGAAGKFEGIGLPTQRYNSFKQPV